MKSPTIDRTAAPDGSVVQCTYAEDIGGAYQGIGETVNGIYGTMLRRARVETPPGWTPPATDADVAAVAGAATDLLLASARVPPTPGTVDLNRASIEELIGESVRRGCPISAQMLWSPKKHWVVGEDSAVDLAELTAFNTLFAVHDRVRTVYPPGLTFTLHAEDLEFEFMEGQSLELQGARNRYIDGLRGLIRALDLDEVFTVIRMSEQAADHAERRAWSGQMEENYRALETYWYDSEARGIAGFASYESFHALQRLGWHGEIPQEMREHYLRRLTIARDASTPEKVKMILRNFSGILLHYQKGLLHTGGPVKPIKFSFIPPAPGAPTQLTRARVDLRFVSRSICSLVGSAGPWSTKGYFRRRRTKILPAFGSWHHAGEAGSRLIEGRMIVGHDDSTADVRADLLLDE